MKRLAVLTAGLGVILLVGWPEISAAEKRSSVLSGNSEAIDSSSTLSLQERAEKNLAYMKPGPADPGKVGCELLVGGMGAIVGGALCGRAGFSLASDRGSGCFGCCDVSGFIGGLVGYLVGSNVGCATGVCLVGNSGDEKGSYWASLGGSLLGTLLGGLVGIGIAADSKNGSEVLPLFVITAAQSGGATMCFNASRKKKVEVPSGAMLNLKDGNLALALPQVNVSQDASNSNCLEVNVFEANF
jgi:hypothetical protein